MEKTQMKKTDMVLEEMLSKEPFGRPCLHTFIPSMCCTSLSNVLPMLLLSGLLLWMFLAICPCAPHLLVSLSGFDLYCLPQVLVLPPSDVLLVRLNPSLPPES